MRSIVFLTIWIVLSSTLFANGMLISDPYNERYCSLVKCRVDINIDGYTAITKSGMNFINQTGLVNRPVFVFPLQNNQTVNQIKWKLNGIWHQADITSSPLLAIAPNEEPIGLNIEHHAGKTPFVYTIPVNLANGAEIYIEVLYSQWIECQNNIFTYQYPSDCTYLNYSPLDSLNINLQVVEPRTITHINTTGLGIVTPVINNNQASCSVSLNNFIQNTDFTFQVQLAMNAQNISSFSSFFSPSYIPDNLGSGFFMLNVEPETNGAVIPKVITFMIDHGPNMNSETLSQTKSAVINMINNLNQDDYFNIIDFSVVAGMFSSSPLPNTETYRNLAINYINALQSGIYSFFSGAFDVAISQYNNPDLSKLNIIILITADLPNSGITDPIALANHINYTINETQSNLHLFCFGINPDVNIQLLSAITNPNHGQAFFLDNNEVSSFISDYYLKINNPKILNPQLLIPDYVQNLTEIYPNPLPYLSFGQPLLISGRYQTPQNIDMELSGMAFNLPVSYNFQADLSQQENNQYSFLKKKWAKMKVDNLFNQYYLLDPESSEAMGIKYQISELCSLYGIYSEFATYTVDNNDQTNNLPSVTHNIKILGNYPNPFNTSTTIKYQINSKQNELVEIKIFNIKGQFVKKILQHKMNASDYQVEWKGQDENGTKVSNGVYLFQIKKGNELATKKILFIK